MTSSSTMVHHTTDLRRARAEIVDAAATALDDQQVADVELAVSELLTNALEHGAGGPIVVSHERERHRFVVSVTSPMGAAEVPDLDPSPIPARRASGRGLKIVARLADAVEARRRADFLEVSCWFRPEPT